ncbi:MAG: M17 family peptidase N-terminal domain-containing protein, partial [Myxococcota bacterium]
MLVTVDSRVLSEAKVDLLALPMVQIDLERWRLPARFAAIDRALGGAISAALRSGDFQAKKGESLTLYPDGAIPAVRVLVVGLGPDASADADAFRRAAGTATNSAVSRKARTVAIAVPALRKLKAAHAAGALAEGAVLAAYRFDSYRTGSRKKSKGVDSVALCLERSADVRAARSAAKQG